MSVYFAQADAYIKIGYSADPFSRVSTITTGGKRPADLPRGADARLIGWVPGNEWTESAWHSRFIDDRVAGEWFYIAADVIRAAIWAEPDGIDIWRMSALAVLAADRNPGVMRDQLAAAGIPIEAVEFTGNFSFVDNDWAAWVNDRDTNLGGAA